MYRNYLCFLILVIDPESRVTARNAYLEVHFQPTFFCLFLVRLVMASSWFVCVFLICVFIYLFSLCCPVCPVLISWIMGKYHLGEFQFLFLNRKTSLSIFRSRSQARERISIVFNQVIGWGPPGIASEFTSGRGLCDCERFSLGSGWDWHLGFTDLLSF